VDEPNKKDFEHLRQLSIFHFVGAGLSVAGLAFLAVHYTIMHAVFSDPNLFKGSNGMPPPAEFFAMLKVFYAVFATWFIISGIINLLSAVFLRKHTNRTFSMVVAGFNCLYIPLGTVLGVFTFIVLGRDSVVALYQARQRP
jgi:uncharacterized membrane protein HdeD (DUF308 family)